MLSGNGGVQIAAENRIDITTQNPPLATAYRFESGHRHHKKQDTPRVPCFFRVGRWGKFGILHKRHLLSLSQYATIVTTN